MRRNGAPEFGDPQFLDECGGGLRCSAELGMVTDNRRPGGSGGNAPLLEHDAESRPRHEASGRPAEDGHSPGVRLKQSADQCHRRRFARAIGAEKGGDLTGVDGPGEIPKRLGRTEADTRVGDLDSGGHVVEV
jgi:hypothetical protein